MATFYYDHETQVHVLTDADGVRRTFTPDEMRAICLACNEYLANLVYTYQRRDELRRQREGK